jgi:hypothetical protein
VTGLLNEYDALYQEPAAPPAAAPAVVPAPAPVPNEYDQLYSDDKAVSDVGVAAATAKDANPDKFALADQIGRAMDLPAAVVERNLPELEAKHRQSELTKVLKDNPKLARWYSQFDNARAVSPEDAANLGTLEKLGNAWERGVLGLRQSGSGLALGADARALQNITAVEGRLARGEAPEDIPDIEDTYGARYMTPDERGALRAQVQRSTGQRVLDVAGREIERNRINVDPTVQAALSAKTWGEFWTHFTEKPLTFIATVGTESLPQMGPTIVAGIVGGLAGGPAGAAAAAGAASYGLDYAASVLDAFRDEGIDLNNPLALRQAVNDPDLMGRVGAKAAAHATAVGTFDALSGGVGSKTLAPAKITNRLAREATSMAAQLPVQGALGAAGEIAGTGAAGDEIKPGEVAAEFFGEMIGAPAEVASITGSSALHEVATNRAAAAAAKRNVDFFKALDTSAAGLAMREKLPERTREAVNQILASGPVDTVYVPAAKVQELFQSLGLGDQYDDPLSWFDSLSPGLGQEYTQAAALGADVAIPLDAYYTSIAGTDAHKILAEHLRLHPGEMTHYEATEWEREADAAFERALEEAQSSAGAESAAAGPADAVFEDVVKRQVDAGMAPDQARQQGALYRAFFRIAGEKFKLDPFALYQRYGFEVRREIPQGLAETPVDQMDLLIDELRSSKQPRQKDLVGHSLLEFISRRGGVLEDAGELGAMDAQLWHQGKRGRRKLVRDPDAPKQPGEDFSLDETARAAWEAGYFPERGDQRPDINQLLEAIRGELSGKARYAERNVNAAGVERQQMLKDLDEALYTLGVDPATAPNEVVKEALRRAGANAGADDALFQPMNAGIDLDREVRVIEVTPRFAGMSARAARESFPADVRQSIVAASPIVNRETGWSIEVTGNGFDHAMGKAKDSHGTARDTLERIESLAVLPDILANAALIESRAPQKQTETYRAIHRLFAPVRINDRTYAVRVTVREFHDGVIELDRFDVRRFYDLALDREVAPAGDKSSQQPLPQVAQAPGPSAGATMTLRTLLTGVKGDDGKPYIQSVEGTELFQSVYHGSPHVFDRSQNRAVALNALAREGNRQAVVAQALVDRAGAGPEDLADVLIGVASIPESDRLGSVPTLQPVLTHMRGAILDDPKVLDAVVGAIPIDVVNDLFGSEAAAKVALHDEAMLKDSPAFNADLPVSGSGVDTANPVGLLVRRVAFAAAEVLRVAQGAGREAAEAGSALGAGQSKAFGQGGKSPRASIQLSPGRTVINLFQNADLSSFLHESGHFFLEVTRDLALRPDAPAEVLADWETLKRELGIPDDGPIPVEAHEKWATGFESHLMGGKSPSAELAAAFRRFKAWLTYVYKTIERLGGRVSEPVRQVMDRMLASADEIAQAEASYRLAPAFVTAEAGGMTEAEFQAYMATAQRATLRSG